MEKFVESIVRKWVDFYEDKIGGPRHTANAARLDSYNTRLSAVESKLDKVDGGITTIKWGGGLISLAYVVIQIMHAVRMH
jgi:hypothetical protein